MLVLMLCFACFAAAAAAAAAPPPPHRYEPNWDSLMTRPLPAWYDQAKVSSQLYSLSLCVCVCVRARARVCV